MVAKDYNNNNKTKLSTKAQVGEIDTSAPFQSVKDAVSLFGEGAFSGERPTIRKAKSQSAERVLSKETQLHLTQKELNKLKEQLANVETTKAQALLELDRAKRTVEDLSQKLKSINESKDSSIRDTEVVKYRAKQFADANNCNSIGSDGPSNMDTETAKDTAIRQAAEAEYAAKANMERVGEASI